MKALVYHGPGERAWEDVPDAVIEEPTDVVVRDRPFQISIILWIAATLVIVYRTDQLRELLTQLFA